MKPLVIAISILIIAFLGTLSATEAVNNAGRNTTYHTALEDVGHQCLPRYKNILFIVNLVPILPIIYAFYGQCRKRQASSLSVSKLLVVYSFVMLLRMILMTVTILPTPIVQCNYDKFSPTTGKSFGGCHDLNFSGHVATIVLCVLFLITRQGCNKLFWSIYAIVSSIAVISAREHYTSDVLSAWIVSGLSYIVLMQSSYSHRFWKNVFG